VVVRFLTGQNANTVALTLANRLLRTSEKFDFILLCMDIASYLRIQYGLRESNDKRFREANQQFDYFRKVYDAECLAEELYTTLVVRTVNNRSAQAEVHQTAKEYFERIQPAMEQYHTYKLHMYGYMIGLMYYTSINDYKAAIRYCDKAIAFFKARPYEARVPLQIFYYQHLICNIQLRQFEEGKESAQQCIKLMQEGTFNWFKYRELYLHLLLHTQRYDEAAEVLLSTLEHARFEFLPDNTTEIWRIYESYIYYLGRAGKMEFSAKNRFKLAKFISELWIFNKDKSGMNIAVIIIKWLTLLQERQYGKVLDEVEATEQYCYRHLRGDNTKRSYYFLKMLLQIPMGQFDRKTVESKAAKFMEKLQTYPLQLANQTYEIEILPYEDLWNMALESLDNPLPKGKR
jgi:tetratricopeptide (TPR) repeat protein